MLKLVKVSNNLILVLFLLVITLTLDAQKIEKTKGSAQVRMERHMTVNETYELAEEQAKINAIQNAFGTYTGQQMDMTIKDGIISFNIDGTTKIQGNWIETTDIRYEEHSKEEETDFGVTSVKYVTCIIKGKVRKTVPKAVLEYIVLNGPTLNSRTESFYHNEPLYVYFKSPVMGYLSIFLVDEVAAFYLLPYEDMRYVYQNGVPVQGDKDYLFFSINDNSFDSYVVDEPRLFTSKEGVEYNTIYIIFSEDKYVKPMLEDSSLVNNRIIPRQLSINKFQKWLANNRASSENFQEIRVKVSIEQKN